MSFLGIFGQLILYSFIVGFFFWSLKYGVSFYVFSRKREEINRLEARISILKLHLKGKIKRKCNKIETLLRKEADVLAKLKPKLINLRDLGFSATGDYQRLVANLHEITAEITEHVKFKHKFLLKRPDEKKDEKPILTPEDETREKCRMLVKYDKAHMMIIVEIIETTTELRTKIDEFNVLTEYEKSQKQITNKPDKIDIEDFDLIADLVNQIKNGKEEAPDFQIFDSEESSDAA